jgi:hypothetical protein
MEMIFKCKQCGEEFIDNRVQEKLSKFYGYKYSDNHEVIIEYA